MVSWFHTYVLRRQTISMRSVRSIRHPQAANHLYQGGRSPLRAKPKGVNRDVERASASARTWQQVLGSVEKCQAGGARVVPSPAHPPPSTPPSHSHYPPYLYNRQASRFSNIIPPRQVTASPPEHSLARLTRLTLVVLVHHSFFFHSPSLTLSHCHAHFPFIFLSDHLPSSTHLHPSPHALELFHTPFLQTTKSLGASHFHSIQFIRTPFFI